MKNWIGILFIFLLFMSCKKEYTCTCTYKGQIVSTGTDKVWNRKDAQQYCTDQQNAYAGGPVVTCQLSP